MTKMRGTNILLISPEEWGNNMLSKHHYARFLSVNHSVFFLNPASGYSTIPFGTMGIKEELVSPGLKVISYRNYVPGLNHFPRWLRNWIYRIQSKKILNYIKEKLDIVWSFDPRRYADQKVWKVSNTIYHSVDFHPNSEEEQIAKSSKLVIGLSDLICQGLSSYGVRPIRVTHGCHVDILDLDKVILPGLNSIKAVYTGNFHEHVDYNLLNKLIFENPKCDFILIGPTTPSNISSAALNSTELSKLKEHPNVYMIGSVLGTEIQKYLNAADICLVLFKQEFEMIHHAPHKLLGYLASGKVILSNPIIEYQNMPEHLILIATQDKYISSFNQIVTNLEYWNDLSHIQLRKEFAEANHYEFKVKLILGYIEESKA